MTSARRATSERVPMGLPFNRIGGLLACLLATVVVGSARPAASQTPPAADSSRVAVLSLTSRVFRNTRAIRVYVPPGYDSAANATQRYPVLYLNDGFAVFSVRGWSAQGTLDSLIRGGFIPPMIVVGIDNAASIPGATTPIRDRANEFLPYPDSTEPELPHPRGEEYPAFVVDEVMPLVARTFRTLDGPTNTGIGGSSYGGIAALVTVLRRPGIFGTLLLESTPLFLFGGRLVAEARDLKPWPGAVYVGVGTRETDDVRVLATGHDALKRFVSVARAASPAIRVHFAVVEGATHTSRAWGARLPAALTFLYAAPKP
jgi:enterochelin esterase-like enzyme